MRYKVLVMAFTEITGVPKYRKDPETRKKTRKDAKRRKKTRKGAKRRGKTQKDGKKTQKISKKTPENVVYYSYLINK